MLLITGSEEDVLGRLIKAGQSVSADIIVEMTSDCPIIDWRHVDYLVNLFFSGNMTMFQTLLSGHSRAGLMCRYFL